MTQRAKCAFLAAELGETHSLRLANDAVLPQVGAIAQRALKISTSSTRA